MTILLSRRAMLFACRHLTYQTPQPDGKPRVLERQPAVRKLTRLIYHTVRFYSSNQKLFKQTIHFHSQLFVSKQLHTLLQGCFTKQSDNYSLENKKEKKTKHERSSR